MNDARTPALWPAEQLGEAIEALARRTGLSRGDHHVARVPKPVIERGGSALDRWLDAALHPLGIEAEPAFSSYEETAAMVARAAPAVLRIEQDEIGFALLLSGNARRVHLLGPAQRVVAVPTRRLADRLAASTVAAYAPSVDELLKSASIDPSRRERTRRQLLSRRVEEPVGGVWLLRASPGVPLWKQIRLDRLPRVLLGMLGAHGMVYSLLLGAWAVVGVSALQGRLEAGWLWAWSLLLLTTVPFTMLTTWFQGRLSIGVSGLLKRRLLYGVLRMEPDEIRHQGAGRLLGRVIESEALESLALGGGAMVVLSLIELAMSLFVLSAGVSGALHAGLLIVWIAFMGALSFRLYRRARRWAHQRVELTSDLVERMVGHRTLLAQLPPSRWHEGEDEALERYLALAASMDSSERDALVLVPRGWMIVAMGGLSPAFVLGANAASTAVSLGGMLLAFGALSRASQGLAQLCHAAVAGEQVIGIYRAASRPEATGLPLAMEIAARAPIAAGDRDDPLIDGRDLHFAHEGRGRAVLRGVDMRIEVGDKLLLRGGSGAGKSTLTSLLTGLRRPTSGLLLLHGFDLATLGVHEWRRRVISSPQFHENHVLTGTFAFNLLMGIDWPPPPEAIDRAEVLCRELGLGSLLDRMPGGMLQVVGETGWQLSHGERSRLFLARAMLQGADLVVLDESFAALDPETSERTLRCVVERTPTLLVVAHP